MRATVSLIHVRTPPCIKTAGFVCETGLYFTPSPRRHTPLPMVSRVRAVTSAATQLTSVLHCRSAIAPRRVVADVSKELRRGRVVLTFRCRRLRPPRAHDAVMRPLNASEGMRTPRVRVRETQLAPCDIADEQGPASRRAVLALQASLARASRGPHLSVQVLNEVGALPRSCPVRAFRSRAWRASVAKVQMLTGRIPARTPGLGFIPHLGNDDDGMCDLSPSC